MEIAARLVVVTLALDAIAAFAGREIGLASDDGLDAGGLGLGEEFDRAEHIAVIGHRDRGHAGLLRVFDQRTDLVGAVEQAVLGMNVKMNETHREPNSSSRPSTDASRGTTRDATHYIAVSAEAGCARRHGCPQAGKSATPAYRQLLKAGVMRLRDRAKATALLAGSGASESADAFA